MRFDRFFHWSMNNGAKILFGASLVLILLGVGPFLMALFKETRRLASDLYDPYPGSSEFLMYFNTLFTAVASAVWPFLGAVLIYLLKRFLAGNASASTTSIGDEASDA